MAERAAREPTMEEIVVALRETKRNADRLQPTVVGERPHRPRMIRGLAAPTEVADLRDEEIDRLLAENARLNARVISLLKVVEYEQTSNSAVAPPEIDRNAIAQELRGAFEAEFGPILLLLLRLLEGQHAVSPAAARTPHGEKPLGAESEAGPSDWIVDLMHKLDGRTTVADDAIAAPEAMPRRATLRERIAEVFNALRLEPLPPSPRPRFPADPDQEARP